MELNSDTYILTHTRQVGNTWEFPPLGFRAEMGGGRPFDQATAWCAAVRGEYERQESERVAASLRPPAPRFTSEGTTTKAHISRDGYVTATGNQQTGEAEIPTGKAAIEDLRKQIQRHETLAADAEGQAEFYESKAEEERERLRLALLVLKVLQKTMEELVDKLSGDTQEVVPSMGTNIHRQVSGGEGSSGGVGLQDTAEASAQEGSPSG